MKRASSLAAAILAFVVVMSCSARVTPTLIRNDTGEPRIDLSEWSFTENGSVRLLGNTWEFYWHQLYLPTDFAGGLVEDQPGYIEGGRCWSVAPDYGEAALRVSDGFATYRTKVIVPIANIEYAFYMQNQDSAYRLWIDGVLRAENGVVSDSPQSYKPQRLPRLFFHHAGDNELEIVLQVNNFTHKWGGLTNNIYMGLPDQMIAFVETLSTFVLFFSGAITVMALYHLFLFITRRKSLSSLYFSLFCFSVLLWYLFNGDYLFFKLLPDFPLAPGIRLQYLSLSGAMPLFMMFVDAAYPDVPGRRITRGMAYAGFAFMLVPILTPVKFFTVFSLPLAYAFIVAGLLWMLFQLIQATLGGSMGARYSLAGFVIFFCTVIYDILADRKLILGNALGPFSPAGLVTFILFQSFALARRFAVDYARLDDLTANLEDKVRSRTEELERTREKIHEKEKLAALGTLAGGVAHEILNPLSGITGPLGVIKKEIAASSLADNESVYRHLSYIDDNINTISTAIKNLDALIKDRDIVKSPVPLLPVAREAVAQCPIPDGKRVDIRFDIGEDDTVMADPGVLRQILLAVLRNSVDAMEKDGTVNIRVDHDNKPEAHDGDTIFIEDSGQGMSQEELSQAFDAFYTTKTTQGGTGLGLYLAQRLATGLGWEMELSSSLGEGTRVAIRTGDTHSTSSR